MVKALTYGEFGHGLKGKERFTPTLVYYLQGESKIVNFLLNKNMRQFGVAHEV